MCLNADAGERVLAYLFFTKKNDCLLQLGLTAVF